MPLLLGLLLLVVLLVIGGALLGLAFRLVWFLLAGLLIGALARLIIPGDQRLGLLATALFGAAGSLIGGLVAEGLLDLGFLGSLLLSVLAAAALVAGFGARFARGGGDGPHAHR